MNTITMYSKAQSTHLVLAVLMYILFFQKYLSNNIVVIASGSFFHMVMH